MTYTERRWDRAQRRAYKQSLDDALAELARFPELGRACSEYGAGIRSYRVRQHLVIYEVAETDVRIARILHVRREIDSEFEESS